MSKQTLGALPRGRWEQFPASFVLLLAAEGVLLASAHALPGPAWVAVGGAAAFFLLLVLPLPAVVAVFLLAGALFPFSEGRFRVTLSVLAGLLLLLLLSDRLRLLLRGRLFGEATPLGPPLALFGLSIVLSTVLAVGHGYTLEQWPLEAFPLACLMAAPVLVRTMKTDTVARITSIYVSVLFVQSAYAIYSFIDHGFTRLHTPSFSIHPGLGAMLALAALAFHEKRAWRIAAGLAIPVLLLQVVATLTRGYWLGFLAGAAAILFMAYRLLDAARFRAVAVKLLAGCVIMGALVLAALAHWGMLESLEIVSKRAGTLSDLGVDASTRVRVTEWTLAAKHFAKSPVLGTGYGFALEFFDPLTRARTSRWWFVHNSYLFFLLKMGVLGLAAFFWILAVFFRRTLRALPRVGGVDRVLLVGFVASTIQLLVMAATNYTFFSADNTPLVAFLLGSGLALSHRAGS